MSATPGKSGLHRGVRERTWWIALVVVAVALVVLAWGPWQRGSVGAALPLPSATSEESAELTSAKEPAPASAFPSAPEPSPEPSLTQTSNSRPATPSVPSGIFDARTAQGLFLSAEQLAAAVPAASDAAAPPEQPAPLWGLPPGTAVVPPECQVAVTVAGRQPIGYATRTWTGSQVGFRQDVVLLAGPVNARRVFATLVGTVDACPQYREVAADGGATVWDAQPAIEGQGLFPSIVQRVTADDGSGTVTSGYRGHLLVGNAIVTWTARTAGTATTIGSQDALADVVQERALAAVRALG